MTKLSALGLFVVLGLAGCHLKPPVTATLDSFGIYQLQTVGRVQDTGVSSGAVNFASSQNLLKQTDVVDARLGLTFGLNFTPRGTPPAAQIHVKARITHPPIRNPQTNRVFTVEEYSRTERLGIPSFSSFTFENEWEMVPGKWTFQICYGDDVIVEKSFTVVEGAKSP